MKQDLTAHMLVCNEEKWISFAISSVLSNVSQILIYDTGSTDKTVEIIKQIKSEKIFLQKKGKVNPKELIVLRNEQIQMTKTKWFMILDGDEAYPKRIFDKLNLDEKYFGIYLKNHLCVGDIYHSLPERYGKYVLCGHHGHLNMRFYRLIDGWRWWGEFPLEYYGDEKGNSINKMCDKLLFLDDYYWHMSFMERSSVQSSNHIKYHLGEKIEDKVPEVFNKNFVSTKSFGYMCRSIIETPIRFLKSL